MRIAMSKKIVSTVVILMMTSTAFCQAAAALKIHLPREITIDADELTLDKICILQGDEVLMSKAGSIKLGRFVLPSDQIVIDRTTLLSRLANNGVNKTKVKIK